MFERLVLGEMAVLELSSPGLPRPDANPPCVCADVPILDCPVATWSPVCSFAHVVRFQGSPVSLAHITVSFPCGFVIPRCVDTQAPSAIQKPRAPVKASVSPEDLRRRSKYCGFSRDIPRPRTPSRQLSDPRTRLANGHTSVAIRPRCSGTRLRVPAPGGCDAVGDAPGRRWGGPYAPQTRRWMLFSLSPFVPQKRKAPDVRRQEGRCFVSEAA